MMVWVATSPPTILRKPNDGPLMTNITLIAAVKFGLEAIVKREVQALGFENIAVSDGKVAFEATPNDIPKANIWLRCADRVLLEIGRFEAHTFDELFEKTKVLAWEEWITKDGKFTVNAKTIKSTLRSGRSCQSIVKKAVVERLKEQYHQQWFSETGPEFTIQVSLLKNIATLTIDTSGAGLHKRGYRMTAGEAPLKETLAAALVKLSFWREDRLLIDPMCGAGTILIEAAMIARNIAPGLDRSFASDGWPSIDAQAWHETRVAAREAMTFGDSLRLFGYDIHAPNIDACQMNAHNAGVFEDIQFEQKNVHDLWIDQQYGVLITNPPYGMRMSGFQEVNQIYISMNKMFRKKKGWSIYVLTADKKFPNYFKRAKPNRVRKLYNGTIEVNYYQYFGEKPS